MFQWTKLHSSCRWFTNWTRNSDRAGIFLVWKRGRCKSSGGNSPCGTGSRSRSDTGFEHFNEFLLPRFSETSHLQILWTEKVLRVSRATRTSRLIWQIIFVQTLCNVYKTLNKMSWHILCVFCFDAKGIKFLITYLIYCSVSYK